MSFACINFTKSGKSPPVISPSVFPAYSGRADLSATEFPTAWAEATFRSSEIASLLIDGRNGVQIETVKLWRDLDRRNKSRMVFINRGEEERTDDEAIAKDIHDKFNVEVCRVTIPMKKSGKWEGVIDVLNGRAYPVPAAGAKETDTDIPADYKAEYETALSILAGAAAEGDDDLLIKFIDEGELTPDEISKGLKEASVLR